MYDARKAVVYPRPGYVFFISGYWNHERDSEYLLVKRVKPRLVVVDSFRRVGNHDMTKKVRELRFKTRNSWLKYIGYGWSVTFTHKKGLMPNSLHNLERLPAMHWPVRTPRRLDI